MKKMASKRISQTLSSATLWALTFFAVFGLAAIAYAITFPANQPNPASGNVALFVGATPQTYHGASANEYESAQAFCEAAFEFSHVCTPMEMINTYNHDSAALNAETETFWLNSGAPGDLSTLNNDCRAWTSNVSTDFGSIWNASEREGFLASCDQTFKYACCK